MFDDVFTRKAVSEEDYQVLGLTSSATMGEVTNRYHVLSKKNHPDAEDGSSFIFKQIAAAYERIRADRVGGSHNPHLGHESPNGQSAGRGHPGVKPSTSPGGWVWRVTLVGHWRWLWATVVALVLVAVVGTLSFTGAESHRSAASVAATTPAPAPRPTSIATRVVEMPSRPHAAGVPTTAVPATTAPPPVACPTGTLTATGGVSIVTDSITSGQWEADVSGSVTNQMTAPVLVQSAGIQLENQSGALLEPPLAAGGGGATLNPGQSISIDDNQVQTVASSGLPRVVSTLITWEWPTNTPFASCPHAMVAVPNVG